MKDINKVMLIGTVGGDPKFKKFDNGGMVAEFSLATNENYKDKNGEWQENTEWHQITTSGKLAERVEKYIRKGNRLSIEGKIIHQEAKDDSGRRYDKIRAWEIGSQDRRDKTEVATKAKTVENTEVEAGEDDDLPF